MRGGKRLRSKAKTPKKGKMANDPFGNLVRLVQTLAGDGDAALNIVQAAKITELETKLQDATVALASGLDSTAKAAITANLERTKSEIQKFKADDLRVAQEVEDALKEIGEPHINPQHLDVSRVMKLREAIKKQKLELKAAQEAAASAASAAGQQVAPQAPVQAPAQPDLEAKIASVESELGLSAAGSQEDRLEACKLAIQGASNKIKGGITVFDVALHAQSLQQNATDLENLIRDKFYNQLKAWNEKLKPDTDLFAQPADLSATTMATSISQSIEKIQASIVKKVAESEEQRLEEQKATDACKKEFALLARDIGKIQKDVLKVPPFNVKSKNIADDLSHEVADLVQKEKHCEQEKNIGVAEMAAAFKAFNGKAPPALSQHMQLKELTTAITAQNAKLKEFAKVLGVAETNNVEDQISEINAQMQLAKPAIERLCTAFSVNPCTGSLSAKVDNFTRLENQLILELSLLNSKQSVDQGATALVELATLKARFAALESSVSSSVNSSAAACAASSAALKAAVESAFTTIGVQAPSNASIKLDVDALTTILIEQKTLVEQVAAALGVTPKDNQKDSLTLFKSEIEEARQDVESGVEVFRQLGEAKVTSLKTNAHTLADAVASKHKDQLREWRNLLLGKPPDYRPSSTATDLATDLTTMITDCATRSSTNKEKFQKVSKDLEECGEYKSSEEESVKNLSNELNSVTKQSEPAKTSIKDLSANIMKLVSEGEVCKAELAALNKPQVVALPPNIDKAFKALGGAGQTTQEQQITSIVETIDLQQKSLDKALVTLGLPPNANIVTQVTNVNDEVKKAHDSFKEVCAAFGLAANGSLSAKVTQLLQLENQWIAKLAALHPNQPAAQQGFQPVQVKTLVGELEKFESEFTRLQDESKSATTAISGAFAALGDPLSTAATLKLQIDALTSGLEQRKTSLDDGIKKVASKLGVLPEATHAGSLALFNTELANIKSDIEKSVRAFDRSSNGPLKANASKVEQSIQTKVKNQLAQWYIDLRGEEEFELEPVSLTGTAKLTEDITKYIKALTGRAKAKTQDQEEKDRQLSIKASKCASDLNQKDKALKDVLTGINKIEGEVLKKGVVSKKPKKAVKQLSADILQLVGAKQSCQDQLDAFKSTSAPTVAQTVAASFAALNGGSPQGPEEQQLATISTIITQQHESLNEALVEFGLSEKSNIIDQIADLKKELTEIKKQSNEALKSFFVTESEDANIPQAPNAPKPQSTKVQDIASMAQKVREKLPAAARALNLPVLSAVKPDEMIEELVTKIQEQQAPLAAQIDKLAKALDISNVGPTSLASLMFLTSQSKARNTALASKLPSVAATKYDNLNAYIDQTKQMITAIDSAYNRWPMKQNPAPATAAEKLAQITSGIATFVALDDAVKRVFPPAAGQSSEAAVAAVKRKVDECATHEQQIKDQIAAAEQVAANPSFVVPPRKANAPELSQEAKQIADLTQKIKSLGEDKVACSSALTPGSTSLISAFDALPAESRPAVDADHAKAIANIRQSIVSLVEKDSALNTRISQTSKWINGESLAEPPAIQSPDLENIIVRLITFINEKSRLDGFLYKAVEQLASAGANGDFPTMIAQVLNAKKDCDRLASVTSASGVSLAEAFKNSVAAVGKTPSSNADPIIQLAENMRTTLAANEEYIKTKLKLKEARSLAISALRQMWLFYAKVDPQVWDDAQLKTLFTEGNNIDLKVRFNALDKIFKERYDEEKNLTNQIIQIIEKGLQATVAPAQPSALAQPGAPAQPGAKATAEQLATDPNGSPMNLAAVQKLAAIFMLRLARIAKGYSQMAFSDSPGEYESLEQSVSSGNFSAALAQKPTIHKVIAESGDYFARLVDASHGPNKKLTKYLKETVNNLIAIVDAVDEKIFINRLITVKKTLRGEFNVVKLHLPNAPGDSDTQTLLYYAVDNGLTAQNIQKIIDQITNNNTTLLKMVGEYFDVYMAHPGVYDDWIDENEMHGFTNGDYTLENLEKALEWKNSNSHGGISRHRALLHEVKTQTAKMWTVLQDSYKMHQACERLSTANVLPNGHENFQGPMTAVKWNFAQRWFSSFSFKKFIDMAKTGCNLKQKVKAGNGFVDDFVFKPIL